LPDRYYSNFTYWDPEKDVRHPGVIVASLAAVGGLSEHRNRMVADIAGDTAFLKIIAGDIAQAQNSIQSSDGQESDVGGDGGTVKFQAGVEVEFEPEKGLFAVTHQVTPESLRYLKKESHERIIAEKQPFRS
jgi:hypothetical protein